MIPGLTTRLSEEKIVLASIITPKSDLVRVTDTTTTTVVATIIPPFAGFSGIFVLVNDSGNGITTVTTGNIATARTIINKQAIPLVYSKLADKWFNIIA